MRERTNLGKKVGYGLAIVALLFVLSTLGAPATVDAPGGTLAQLRTKNQLSQSQLGEIDPASETIKLATLGLRGLATQILWDRATHFKKVEDWTNLTATLEQLAKLQPNFITFWKYQSWNLSYNVSVEFDDYHDRYYWVRRGIQFLEQGNEYNRDNPVLEWELGWVLGQKIGRADEKVQYRRLFKADDEYHPEDRPPAKRDNWVVSKDAYLDGIVSIDEKGKDLGKKSPSIFYSSPAKSQMNYSEAIEEEGLFESAVAAWKVAGDEWREFGNVPIQHTQGPILKFNDEEYLTEQVEELTNRLYDMSPGVEARLAEESLASLTPAQIAAFEADPATLDDAQSELRFQANEAVRVTPQRLAEKIAEELPEKAREARELASDIQNTEKRRRFTRNYKDTTNYDYWALRCAFEQTKAAVTARSLIFRARRLFLENGDPVGAKGLYEEAFDRWAEVFEEFPDLKDGEGTTGDDVMVFVYEYNEVLEQLDEQIPDDFPLWEIIETFDVDQVFTEALRNRELERRRLEATDATETEEPASKSESETEPTAGDPPSDAEEPEAAAAEEPPKAEAPAEESAEAKATEAEAVEEASAESAVESAASDAS